MMNNNTSNSDNILTKLRKKRALQHKKIELVRTKQAKSAKRRYIV